LIVVDTSVLVYAVGSDHPLREPCLRLLRATAAGALRATTTVEVIQEFAHVYARRRPRGDAVAIARDHARVLAPLLVSSREALERALTLFETQAALGSFDALLAAEALTHDAEALVSGDRGFATVPDLPYVDPATLELERLLA
jgi:predicted nucleic acid-binding protein